MKLLKDIDQLHKFSRLFSSKLLLAGEYTVIDGGTSLAVPFHKFHAKLVFDEHKPPTYDWQPYIEYLKSTELSFLNEDIIELDLRQLHFESSIPEGYGCGSSGALVAAFAEMLGLQFEEDQDLKSKLGIMESFFHGKSSGIDPFVIYKNRPIRTINKTISLTSIQKSVLKNIYLFDTGLKRSTSILVDKYQTIVKPKNQNKIQMLSILNTELVNLLTSESDEAQFIACWKQVSKLQFEVFDLFSPSHVSEIWNNGINDGTHYVKMCGAGGGGFYYVYTESDEVVKRYNLMAVASYL